MRNEFEEELGGGELDGDDDMLNNVTEEIRVKEGNLFMVLVGGTFCLILNFFFGIYAVIQGSQSAQITFVFIANIVLILTVLLVYLYD